MLIEAIRLEDLIQALVRAHVARSNAASLEEREAFSRKATELADAVFVVAPVPGVRIPDLAFVYSTPTPYGQRV
jgi:hypothetical protein